MRWLHPGAENEQKILEVSVQAQTLKSLCPMTTVTQARALLLQQVPVQAQTLKKAVPYDCSNPSKCPVTTVSAPILQ